MPIAGRKRLGVANPVRQRGLSDLELGMRDAISARDEPDDQRRQESRRPAHAPPAARRWRLLGRV